MIWLFSLISVLAVSLISFIGVAFLSIKAERLHQLLIYLVSFAAGAFFGDVFIHLIPEIAETGFTIKTALASLGGVVFFLIIEKLIQWRHCHHPTTEEHPHPFATINLIGDGVHNLVDGMIIGASYLIGTPVGIATTIAVILHEIPQEIGDFGVLLYSGMNKKRALFFNFLSAATAILGTLIALIASIYLQTITAVLIPFAVGSFLYIAGSDLIPEMQKETNTKKSLIQISAFIFGIALMALLLLVE